MQIQELEARDQEFDTQLDRIGEGIMDLVEIAEQQGEEVRRQNVMLDNVTCVLVFLVCLCFSNYLTFLKCCSEKIDNTNERVGGVNLRMKETLDEVGRSSDKLCIDIMCIVMAVGFGSVFYNMAT